MRPDNTLKKNYEFRRMYRQGRQVVGPQMVLYCRRNRLQTNRIGITVSVRVGNAVTRNRIRRRLREVYRLHTAELATGWDLVLVGRGQARDASWPELNGTFLRLCRKLDLLKPGKP